MSTSDPSQPADPSDPSEPSDHVAPRSVPARRTPLVESALETERHVAGGGWDQPPRLFALVSTHELARREPGLAATLPVQPEPGYTAIEQDDLPPSTSIEDMLARLAWPQEVDGVAIALERIVVPPHVEADLPRDAEQALARLASHPERAEVRLLAAVLRDGQSCCLLRQRAHDRDDRVAVGAQIAPGLVHALSATLLD